MRVIDGKIKMFIWKNSLLAVLSNKHLKFAIHLRDYMVEKQYHKYTNKAVNAWYTIRVNN